MIEIGHSLFALLPQATERIDFSLESGVILFAIAFFVLVNVLLAAVLYPYFKNSSSAEGENDVKAGPGQDAELDDVAAHDEEELERRVDDFLEDIHKERSG